MFKFWKRSAGRNVHEQPDDLQETVLTIDALRQMLANMYDAEFIERQTTRDQKVDIVYIRTLIDQGRLNEAIIEPIYRCSQETVYDCIADINASAVGTLLEAHNLLLQGFVLVHDSSINQWWSVPLQNPLSRAIEPSETETIIYGPKDSFSEQIEQNITMIRRRMPIAKLKTEMFSIGYLSKTKIVMIYVEGLTNPEFISTTRSKLSNIDFDLILESSNVTAFMDDHTHSVFPQYMQTDRPDACVYSLGLGKLIILVDNTPFAIIAPITFFHLFQSPEDYINRWMVASFFRCIRYLSFFLAITLIPLYVALSTHHYQMLPLQILFVLLESRSKLPFTPFWESFLMLITLEIIKEASLRMPTKSGQTLGVIGGIVIGQAAVQAGFASKVLIVLVGISSIASFLVPNYLMTKSNTLIHFIFLVLSAFLGIFGIAIGLIALLIHLNGLTSLKQPYFSPVAPFHAGEWMDLFIRGPLPLMKTRPDSLKPLDKRRYWRRR
ncbi:spore germination protein [Paenibacillus naphthalenovorans]|uniref:spore germination protein n=1 Tax=Paenibacillus naphthalenovorans TaxID=162209 RepID=UPI003D28D6CD